MSSKLLDEEKSAGPVDAEGVQGVPFDELKELLQEAPPRLSQAMGLVAEQLGLGSEFEFPKPQRKTRRHRRQNPTFVLYPDLAARPWYNRTDFDWVEELEAHWEQMLYEYVSVRTGDLDQIKASVADGGLWNTFTFIEEGAWNEDNCKRCPITTRMLKRIPVLSGCSLGYAYFSIIHPNTHITSHCGVCNIKLRCQLPLIVPTEDMDILGIRVNTRSLSYRQGECLIFDDSFEHEVWYERTQGASELNDLDNTVEQTETDEDQLRVVLLFDFWHPEFTEMEKIVVSRCLPAPKSKSHASKRS